MIRLITMSALGIGMVLAIPAAGAQTVIRRDTVIGDKRMTSTLTQVFNPRTGLIGLTVSSSTTPRDTLGILVSAVTAGSAAEKAGLAEGNRIAAINGVNLKLHPADAGQPDMQGIMSRRFQRELTKTRPGDSVKFSVFADSRFRDITVKTEAPVARRVVKTGEDENRATLGAVVGGTASKRDTLGVLIAEIAENGPLAKNGIYEGSRLAQIGGVDLRVPVANAGDEKISAQKADLLVAELAKLTPGARVELRVYDSGRFRNVTVETMRRGDVAMPGVLGKFHIRGGGGADNFLQLEHLPLNGQDFQVHRLQLDSLLMNLDRHVIDPSRVKIMELDGLHERLKDLPLMLRQHLDTLRLPLMLNGRRIGASD